MLDKNMEEYAMIELPETSVLARQVEATLRGRRIAQAEADHTPHGFSRYTGDPALYGSVLSGRVLLGAHPEGGGVHIALEGMTLTTDTSLRYHAAGEKLPAKHQLCLTFDDGAAVTTTIRMWGGFHYYAHDGGACGAPHEDKPSPYSEAFDWPYFEGLLQNTPDNLSVKAFLATEQRIPGLGNGVLQDILWRAGLHPRHKLAAVSPEKRWVLYDTVVRTLREMEAQGGRDTEKDLYGANGGYITQMSKLTVGKPCPRCGAIIVKAAYLGGSVYVCPGCQPVA